MQDQTLQMEVVPVLSTYHVSDQLLYSKVCGRVIGYQFASPDAFLNADTGAPRNFTIDQPYLDGVSITHSMPHTHIWSYAAGATESGSRFAHYNCPCSNGIDAQPTYVGNNYFCESANSGGLFTVNTYFPNNPLWDGQQCDNEGVCYTGTNTPPWFSVNLRNPTSHDIEVRICHDQPNADEDTPIQLLELYVQQ